MSKKLPSIINLSEKFAIPRRTEKDLTEIGKKAREDLLHITKESLRKNPKGMWQELRSLPKVLQEAWKQEAVPQFKQAAKQIKAAIKTKDTTAILGSLLDATCSLMQGFINFFSYVSSKAPTLTTIAKNAVKIALVVGVAVAAPYLSPASLAVLINIDLVLLAGGHFLNEFSKKTTKIQQLYETLNQKHGNLKEIEQIAIASNALNEKFSNGSIEETAVLGLKPKQAKILIEKETGRQELQSLINASKVLPNNNAAFKQLKMQIKQLVCKDKASEVKEVLQAINKAQRRLLGKNLDIFKQAENLKELHLAIQKIPGLQEIEQKHFAQPIGIISQIAAATPELVAQEQKMAAKKQTAKRARHHGKGK